MEKQIKNNTPEFTIPAAVKSTNAGDAGFVIPQTQTAAWFYLYFHNVAFTPAMGHHRIYYSNAQIPTGTELRITTIQFYRNIYIPGWPVGADQVNFLFSLFADKISLDHQVLTPHWTGKDEFNDLLVIKNLNVVAPPSSWLNFYFKCINPLPLTNYELDGYVLLNGYLRPSTLPTSEGKQLTVAEAEQGQTGALL